MTETFTRQTLDPAREPWEQDLLSLALKLSRSDDDVVPVEMEGNRIYFVNSAAGAQHVLVEQRHRYVSVPLPLGKISRSLTEPGAALLRQKLRDAPTVPSPPLNELVTTAIDALLQRLAGSSVDSPVDLMPVFKATLLGLMTRALFGVTMPAQQIEAAADAKQKMERYRAYQLPPGTISRDTEPWRRLQTAYEIECNYSCEILSHAGLNALLPSASDPMPCFDGEPLGISVAQPVAIVSRVLMNSYNGPAIALSWLAWILGRNPAVQEKIAKEAGGVFGTGSFVFGEAIVLPYARQVVQETLRLYPPAWLLTRQAIEDDAIGIFRIEKNTTVVVSPYTLHRDGRYWPEPERFLPERFETSNAKAPEPGTYLPFGLGPTMCPASAFAMKELQYTIARFAHRFEFRTAPNSHVQPWGLISLHPTPGVALVLRERGTTA